MSNGLLRRLQAGFLAAFISWHAVADPILRFQKDEARERGWILTPHGVVVVDYKARGTVAFVDLPQWVWVGEEFSCPPDLALGPKGEAVVSSNVVPTLWRIDPVSLAVTRHDLAIDAHKDKDVGFTALAWSADLGVFLARSDFGARWRIDPLLRRAQAVALSEPIPLRQSCN